MTTIDPDQPAAEPNSEEPNQPDISHVMLAFRRTAQFVGLSVEEFAWRVYTELEKARIEGRELPRIHLSTEDVFPESIEGTEDQQGESAVAGPTAEILDAELKAVAKTATKTQAEVGVFKWILGLIAGMFALSLFNAIWTSATLVTQVKNLEVRADKADTRLEKIEERLGGIDKRLERIEVRIDGLELRFNALEAKMNLILDRLPAPRPAAGG